MFILRKLGSAPDLYTSGLLTLPLGAPHRARLSWRLAMANVPPPPLLLSSPTYNPLHPSCRQSPESAPSVRPYLAPCPINPTPAPLKMAQNRRFCRQIPLQTRSCGADRRPWRSPADPFCKFPCKIKKRTDRSFSNSPRRIIILFLASDFFATHHLLHVSSRTMHFSRL